MDLFNHENLNGHVQFILRWIRSCETSEQINLLKLFISKTLVPGYEKTIEETKGKADIKAFKFDLEIYKKDLEEEIQNRTLLLSGNNKAAT